MMKPGKQVKLDEVGRWSEIKLEILAKYASAYTKILHARRLHPIYIDAFAGAGKHISRKTNELILGSPLDALKVEPPFEEFHLVDLKQERVDHLRQQVAGRAHVHIYNADANTILLSEVFPTIRYEEFKRGLCVLDPYGLDLEWRVLKAAGDTGTIEIFLNFPVMDMNRNVFLWRPEEASQKNIERMNKFWGDDSWHKAAYRTDTNLFGEEEKQPNEVIAAAFQQRLRNVAGFKYVPEPAPMRNSVGAIVYYLFFAAHQPTADRIITQIFNRYRKKGELYG